MNRDRGNREWLNDYMSLKQVNPNNPFTVPEGYFDSLNEMILSKIRLEELKNNSSTKLGCTNNKKQLCYAYDH